MLIVKGNSWTDRQAEKPELTKHRALDFSGTGSRYQAPVVASWRWLSPVASLTLDKLWMLSGSELGVESPSDDPVPFSFRDESLGSTGSPYQSVLL